jgi:aspartate/methionine/tyrosine aminotransferase
LTFAARMLAETGVAVAPGVDFDPVEGGHFVRLSFAGDGDEIERGVTIMGEWLARQPTS